MCSVQLSVLQICYNNNNDNNSSQDYNRESRGRFKLQLLYANNGFKNWGENPSAIYTHIILVGFMQAERACSRSRTGFYVFSFGVSAHTGCEH